MRLNLRMCFLLLILLVCTSGVKASDVLNESACFSPFNIQRSTGTESSIDITWTDFTTPSDLLHYELSLVIFGETPDFFLVDTAYTKAYSFSDLQDAQSYQVYIRTVCTSGTTNWTSPTEIHTNIVNGEACTANLKISDNNCPISTSFPIDVVDISGNLGDNLYIQSINLTINHDWPADLDISLISPSGISVSLIQDEGIGTEDLGETAIPCINPLSFEMDACESVGATNSSLIGSFRPEGDLSDFYDNSSANGEWKLEICDDAQGQTGTILFTEILFTETICSAPNDIYFQDIQANTLSLAVPPSSCDSLEIVYESMESNIPISIYIPCTGDTLTIENLDPGSLYMLTYSAMCSGDAFSSSCPNMFTTRCQDADIREDFDDQSICMISCSEPCALNGLWSNHPESAPWIVSTNETSTSLTGPEHDYSGIGNYLYIESSDTFCNNMEAQLISSCIKVVDTSDCNLTFAYHMLGNDITFLAIDISVDNMQNWNTIWQAEGTQSQDWLEAAINLSNFYQEDIQLRFRSLIPENNFGDIAIDEIALSGVVAKTAEDLLIYADADNDGFGDAESSMSFCGNDIPAGYSINNADCDDQNELINPDAFESPCNIIDDNCNGQIDENTDGTTLTYDLINFQNQNCQGVPDGIIQIQALGGIAPYTYTWMDGIMGSERTMLSEGSYHAIIEDQGGCLILTDTFLVETLQNFDFFISSASPATCKGIDDGTITIVHDETNAPYTYLWTNGDTEKNIDSLAVGQYEVQITDVNGCTTQTAPIDLLADRIVGVAVDSLVNIDCYSNSTGFIEVAPINTVGPVSYQWSTGESTDFIANLQKGEYEIEIIDSTGCFATDTFSITEPALLDVKIQVNDPVICYGESNGLLEANIQGGTAPFKITWSNGSEQVQNQNLAAGTYHLTVEDDNGCKDTMNDIIVLQPDTLILTLDNVDPAICSNNNSGAINISVNGGNNEYRYLWSDGIEHETNAENLAAGIYTVTVLDAFDCKVSEENIGVSLLDVALITNIEDTINLNCFEDQSGLISLSVTNPTTLPNRFIINGDTTTVNETEFTADKLSSKNYEIIVLDGNGCTSDTIDINLTQPDDLVLIESEIKSLNCFQDSSGSIAIEVEGGVSPYNIDWNTDEDSTNIENLAAGTYEVFVEDSNGCSDSLLSLVVIEPDLLEPTNYIVTDIPCFDLVTGAIEFGSDNGGTAPYQFISQSWTNIDTNYHELSAGTYNTIIVDTNGCSSDTLTFTITSAPEILIEIDSISPAYCGNANGEIFLSGSGGTGELEYLWGDIEAEGTFAQNVTEGTYDISITDENGCLKSIEDIEIQNIDNEITLELDLIDSVTCHNSENGIIAVGASGTVVAPFSFYLNGTFYEETSVPELFATDLAVDSYDILIIDNNGCADSLENLEILAPPPISFDMEVLDSVKCYNDTNAIIVVTAMGGNGGLEYLWNNSDQGDTIRNLGWGTYTCAIVDNKNCIQFTDTIQLANPDTLILEANIVDATGEDNNGGIYLTVTGGTKPYLFGWNPYLPSEVDTIEGLSESEWLLTLIDDHGCRIDTNFVINRIVNTVESNELKFSLYPTLTNDIITINSDLKIMAWRIYDQKGSLVNQSTKLTDQHSINISNAALSSGLFYLHIETNEGSAIKRFIKN